MHSGVFSNIRMLSFESWGSQLRRGAKMKIIIKSLFTYCDNVNKRPERTVVLALHCSSSPPPPHPPTEWHWARINHMTCSADGGNSLTAEQHRAKYSCHLMKPGDRTGREGKARSRKKQSGEVYFGQDLSPVRRSKWRHLNIALAKVPWEGNLWMEVPGLRMQIRMRARWPESLTLPPLKDCVGRTAFPHKAYQAKLL